MTPITMYFCDFCDVHFVNKSTCMEHEAAHYGLTKDDYAEWETLYKTASDAAKRKVASGTKASADEYKAALENLTEFETAHNVGKTKPKHFAFL